MRVEPAAAAASLQPREFAAQFLFYFVSLFPKEYPVVEVRKNLFKKLLLKNSSYTTPPHPLTGN